MFGYVAETQYKDAGPLVRRLVDSHRMPMG